VHQRPDEQVSGTLVFAILHQEKANKVFGKHYPRNCSQPSQQTVFHPSQAALRPGVFVVNCVELFLHLSLMTSTTTLTSMTSTSTSFHHHHHLRHQRLQLQSTGIIFVI
jgi:hypothetical protein